MITADSGKTGLRVVFAGTPAFAAQHLEALIEDGRHTIVGVFTQPDRPAGRGKQLAASPVKQLAEANRLPVFQPVSLKTAEQQQVLADLNADLMVVVAYGLLLPQVILDTPRLGCINVHASLLPRWRGAAPIQRAIAAGDTETGITIMQMDAGLDTGDMLLKAHCPIAATDTGATLHDKLAELGKRSLPEALTRLADGHLVAECQDNNQACYAPKLSKEEANLDWELDANLLNNRIRAFNPFPIAYSHLDGQRVRIWGALPHPECNRKPAGTIINASNDGLQVACGTGSLVVTHLQLPGKKCLPVSEILKSRADLFSPGRRFHP